MKLKPQHITLAVMLLIVGAGLIGFNYVRANGSSIGQFLGATPSNGDFPGIYNATPTDLGLRDGYGSALLTDANGRLIISPSSTVPATTLTMSGGVANGVLFLDSNKAASSTSRIQANGNVGNVTSTAFVSNSTGYAVNNGFQMRNGSVIGGVLADTTYLYVGTLSGGGNTIRTTIGGTSQLDITTAGLIPSLTDGTKDIGSQTARFGTLFAVSASTTNATTTYAYARGDTVRPAFAIVDPSNGGVNNGIGMSASTYINMITAGNIEAQFGPVNYSNSNFSAYVDNTFDIGQTLTGFRFRHLYLAGNAFSSTLNASTTAGSALDVLTTSGTVKFAGIAAAATGLQPLCVATGGGAVGYGAAGICPVSAFDVKENIKPISYGLDELLRTGFYDFTFKGDLNDGRTHSGPIADVLLNSIQSTMPNLVLRNKESKVIGYDTNSMFGVLGQSIKELNAKVESQQREIVELEARLTKLESK